MPSIPSEEDSYILDVYKRQLVGTKGYTFEGPFYLDLQGNVIGWDAEREQHAEKLVARETEPLRTCLLYTS